MSALQVPEVTYYVHIGGEMVGAYTRAEDALRAYPDADPRATLTAQIEGAAPLQVLP